MGILLQKIRLDLALRAAFSRLLTKAGPCRLVRPPGGRLRASIPFFKIPKAKRHPSDAFCFGAGDGNPFAKDTS